MMFKNNTPKFTNSQTLTRMLEGKFKNSTVSCGFSDGYMWIHAERRGLEGNNTEWPSMYKEFTTWQDFLDWLDSNG